MEQKSNLSHGLKWGLIIGAAYIALLYLRFSIIRSNPLSLTTATILTYLPIVVLLAFAGYRLQKSSGGTISVKEMFKVLFLSVLIFEFCFSLFNFIYLKYVYPEFFQVIKDRLAVALKETDMPADRIKEAVNSINTDAGRQATIFDMLKTYLIAISMSGIVALIISLILRRRSTANSSNS